MNGSAPDVPVGPAEGPGPRDGRLSGRNERLLLSGLVFTCVLIWVVGVGEPQIRGSMEARRALVAREMLRTGDWVVPRVNGEVYLAKPPLFPWAVAAISAPSGDVTETSLRIVSALFALGTLLLIHRAVRCRHGPVTALVAGAVFASLPAVFGQATLGHVNMMLTFFVTLSLVAALDLLEPGGARRPVLSAVLCGVGLAGGLMTKGPIGLMFFVPTVLLATGFGVRDRFSTDPRRAASLLGGSALVVVCATALAAAAGPAFLALQAIPIGVLVWFGTRGEARRVWRRSWWIVLGVTVVLAAPWPVLLQDALGGDRIARALTGEFRGRVSKVGVENYKPLWYYLWNFPATTLPAFLALPLAFLPGSDGADGAGRLSRMARCWLVGSLVVFTVASPAKSGRYVLPATPALAILVADGLVRGLRGDLGGRARSWVRGLGRAIPWAALVVPVGAVVWWLVAGVPVTAWLPVAVVVGLLAVGGGLWLRRRGVVWAPLAALLLALLSAKIVLASGYEDYLARARSPRAAAERLRSHLAPGESLYAAGDFRDAILFYLGSDPWSGAPTDAVAKMVVTAEPGDLPLPADGRAVVVDETKYRGDRYVLVRVLTAPD